MTPSETAKIVRSVLCRGLTFEQSEQIVKAMVPVDAEPGAVVLREGERGQGLLVLVEGSAEIVKQDTGGDGVVISTVMAPTVVGEMSLITDRPHSATVRARLPCEFQLLTRSQFERLLKNESLAAYKLVATPGRRHRLAPRPHGREGGGAHAPERRPAAHRRARRLPAEAVHGVEHLRLSARRRPAGAAGRPGGGTVRSRATA